MSSATAAAAPAALRHRACTAPSLRRCTPLRAAVRVRAAAPRAERTASAPPARVSALAAAASAVAAHAALAAAAFAASPLVRPRGASILPP